MCTGAFALAAARLLDGLRATTDWKDAGELAARTAAARGPVTLTAMALPPRSRFVNSTRRHEPSLTIAGAGATRRYLTLEGPTRTIRGVPARCR